MWLVNTSTLKLEAFVSEQDVEYAILSHRWEEEEVLFEDMIDLDRCTKAGKKKLESCCSIAAESGLLYVWIDTCCIDKKSSAELSEAINSMYRYYATARHCFAYLHDVTVDADSTDFGEQFTHSQWFIRSWTLQELLAPHASYITFHNNIWITLGNKFDLRKLISSATGIDEFALSSETVTHYSIAERMSWASERHATRVEDIAYSLMGIFEVNMPLLYGEGSKAFIRLQEEILKYSNDETLFAWSVPFSDVLDDSTSVDWAEQPRRGLLAPSPVVFKHCRRLQSTRIYERTGFRLTNQGLSGQMTIVENPLDKGVALALLNATFQYPEKRELYTGIYLMKVPTSEQAMSLVYPDEQVFHYVRLIRVSSDAWFGGGQSRWEGDFMIWSSLQPSAREILVLDGVSGNHVSPRHVHGFELDIVSGSNTNRWSMRSQALLLSEHQVNLAPNTGWYIDKTAVLSMGAGSHPVCNLTRRSNPFKGASMVQLGFVHSSSGLVPYCIIADKNFNTLGLVARADQEIPSLDDISHFRVNLDKIPWMGTIVTHDRRWANPKHAYTGFWAVRWTDHTDNLEPPIYFVQPGYIIWSSAWPASWKISFAKCPTTKALQTMWSFHFESTSAQFDRKLLEHEQLIRDEREHEIRTSYIT